MSGKGIPKPNKNSPGNLKASHTLKVIVAFSKCIIFTEDQQNHSGQWHQRYMLLNLAAFFLKENTKYLRGRGISHCRNALITAILLLMSSLSQNSLPFICTENTFLSQGRLQINLCMLLKNWSAVTERIAVTSERGLLMQTAYQCFPYVTAGPFSTETLSFSYQLRMWQHDLSWN